MVFVLPGLFIYFTGVWTAFCCLDLRTSFLEIKHDLLDGVLMKNKSRVKQPVIEHATGLCLSENSRFILCVSKLIKLLDSVSKSGANNKYININNNNSTSIVL